MDVGEICSLQSRTRARIRGHSHDEAIFNDIRTMSGDTRTFARTRMRHTVGASDSWTERNDLVRTNADLRSQIGKIFESCTFLF